MNPNTAAAIQLLVELGIKIFALYQQATAEGRDITPAELQQLTDIRNAKLAALKGLAGA